MTENPPKKDPDFNEFWDELISKSDWAKENVGKLSVEFQNLGVLQSKPKLESRQNNSPETKIPPMRPTDTVGYLQKILSWLSIIIVSILLTTLIFNLIVRPKQIYCMLGQMTRVHLGETCSINPPEIEVPAVRINDTKDSIDLECPNGEMWSTTTNTCEAYVKHQTQPSTTSSSSGLPESGINNIEKSDLKASVIKSLVN